VKGIESVLKFRSVWDSDSYPVAFKKVSSDVFQKRGELRPISAQIRMSSYKGRTRYSGAGWNPASLVFSVKSIGKDTGPQLALRSRQSLSGS